jgi:hypothetical protein
MALTDTEKRDLLVRLAEGVMGWKPEYVENFKAWNPLESIADAWMLVDALAAKGVYLELSQGPRGWDARFDDPPSDWSGGDTAPMAICLAADAVLRAAS